MSCSSVSLIGMGRSIYEGKGADMAGRFDSWSRWCQEAHWTIIDPMLP